MQIRKLYPITNGMRHQIIITKSILSKNINLINYLNKYYHRKKGRSLGKITIRHKGKGHKQLYRTINFGNFFGKLIVLSNCYDPYRTSFISLIFNLVEKKFDFLVMSFCLCVGSFILFDFQESHLDLKLGYRTLIKNIPAGSFISNISISYLHRSTYIRSAGTFGQIIQKTRTYFKIRLPSGIILTVCNLATATFGGVSNRNNKNICIGKAGRNRLLGVRPAVRGVAMNPVDHPHGGQTSGGIKKCMTP